MWNPKPKKYKISFCTVCMNRLGFLKQTLPKNIEDNLSYGNIEFVALNYNSKDGMDNWIRAEMADYIRTGVLKYIRTNEPKYFLMSHSKNIAHKYASGEIICNVDADNFIGQGFAEYINDIFHGNDKIYMGVNATTLNKGCFGRICMKKEDYLTLQGYDESMKGYGFEDYDMRNRLELLGREVRYIDIAYLKTLDHDDNTRLENEPNTHQIRGIYFKNIDHAKTKLLYLMDSSVFFEGVIIINSLFNSLSIDNLFKENRYLELVRNGFPQEYRNRLKDGEWRKGRYLFKNGKIALNCENGEMVTLFEKSGDQLHKIDVGKEEIYFKIVNRDNFFDMVMFFSQINNRIKTKENFRRKDLAPNGGSFGNITLYQYKLNNQMNKWIKI